MQTSSLKMVLDSVLGAGVSDLAIFQGRELSKPARKILAQPDCAIRPLFVDLRDQNKVLEYCKEDQVISVETGMTLARLNENLAPNGQYLPVFGPAELTLLELINGGDSGYLEHSYGLRSIVLGLQVLLANGDTIKTGGKVVKNVSGYDLTKLFIGARGTLGIPTRAHLRVYARHEHTEAFVVHGISIEQLLSLASRLVHSGLPLAGIELISGGDTCIDDKLPAEFLLVTVSEHRDVISELKPLLQKLFDESCSRVQKIEMAAHDALHMLLSHNFDWDTNILISSLSRVQLQTILPLLSENGMFQLLYRPGTGRMTARFADDQALKSALEKLSAVASKSGSLLIDIARADDRFDFRVDQLSGNDSKILKVKTQIKEKFDPLYKMNPLAKM